MKRKTKSSTLNYTYLAIIGGVFILGIGIGIAFSSSANLSAENVASRDFIDRAAPNPDLCAQYGASAMVMDTRIFVTLNPFNVYVAQPSMRPGCVLRSNNWAILEQRQLLTADQVRDCRNRMNTFGYSDELNKPGAKEQISCIYQNNSAKNFFLNQPGAGAPPSESNQF